MNRGNDSLGLPITPKPITKEFNPLGYERNRRFLAIHFQEHLSFHIFADIS